MPFHNLLAVGVVFEFVVIFVAKFLFRAILDHLREENVALVCELE